MYKIWLVLVFFSMALSASAQLGKEEAEEELRDSTHFFMFSDPNRAVFKLGDNFFKTRKWSVFKRGVYPIEISARYRIPILDTIDLSTDRKAVVLEYKLQYTPEAASLTRRMALGTIPLGVSAVVSFRQFTWLTVEQQGLISLADEIEMSTFAAKLEKEFAKRKVVYNYNRVVFGASNIVFCWSAYRLYKLRTARRDLREDSPLVIETSSLQFNPFYDSKFNACGTSLVFSF